MKCATASSATPSSAASGARKPQPRPTVHVKTFTSSVYVLDDRTMGDLPNFIHKVHAGPLLAHQNYDYGGVTMNHVTYPQDLRNCTKCHDGSATSTAKTLQGDNWKTMPSAKACGSCHDGVNFKTGVGVTMADKAAGATTTNINGTGLAHPAGPLPDDSQCVLCHKSDASFPAADVDLAHLPVTPPEPRATALHVAGGTNANSNAGLDRLEHEHACRSGAIKVSPTTSRASVRLRRASSP